MSTLPIHLNSMGTPKLHNLNQKLLSPLNPDARRIIISELFDVDFDKDDFLRDQSGYNAEEYFNYYQEQCEVAYHKAGPENPFKTHQDVLNLAKLVKSRSLDFRKSRMNIARELRSGPTSSDMGPTEEVLRDWIDFVARLLLMMHIGGFQGVMIPGQIPLRWIDDESCLQDMVKKTFKPETHLKEPIKLEGLFKAMNLDRIAGLQIVIEAMGLTVNPKWTSNLADHLRLQDDDTRIAIFHHATYLHWQRESHLFPDGFVEETLRTIALLLPQFDKLSTKWYLAHRGHHNLDIRATKCGQLSAENRHISNFVFWHDRLVILKQVFDEAEPRTIAQWWHDRRKGVQWYTFWLAAIVLLLTIVFGSIQCVEGGLQVYKAYYPS